MRAQRDRRKALGARAEDRVCEHLVARGFRILERNVRVGPKEIDIVARRGDLLVFCEVRARASAAFVSPLETIGPTKIRNIRDAARRYLAEREIRGLAIRFDAAAVVFDVPEGRLDYIENAF
jgi:putative endonuclease